MTFIILFSALLAVAVLYAAVGHGGASGYLAVLLLAGFAPESLRPLVLMMNVVVTSYLLLQVKRDTWRQYSYLSVLIAFSVPAAFLGGSVQLDDSIYRAVLGLLLIVSALRLVSSKQGDVQIVKPKNIQLIPVALLLGFLAGLTGIGGGVLLSPLLIIFRWATVRQSVAVVAAFILINSLAGLSGWLYSGRPLLAFEAPFFFAALAVAFIGAIVGSFWSKQYASNKALRYVLVFVLLLAGFKMMASLLRV